MANSHPPGGHRNRTGAGRVALAARDREHKHTGERQGGTSRDVVLEPLEREPW